MERIVVTVEALRCTRCRVLMAPDAPFFQHQMLAEVSDNREIGITHTYKLADVCGSCHILFMLAAQQEYQRAWWRRFWWGALAVNITLAVYYPVGSYPFVIALGVRCLWKLKRKWEGLTLRSRAVTVGTIS